MLRTTLNGGDIVLNGTSSVVNPQSADIDFSINSSVGEIFKVDAGADTLTLGSATGSVLFPAGSALTLGGISASDILVSTDGASTSDTALVTAGYVDAHGGTGYTAGSGLALSGSEFSLDVASYVATGAISMASEAVSNFTINAGSNLYLYGGATAALDSGGGTGITATQSTSGVVVQSGGAAILTSASSTATYLSSQNNTDINITAAGTGAVSIGSATDISSLTLNGSTASVSDIETTITNVDTAIPTSGAIFDYAAPVANGVSNGDSHDHSGGDGAQIDHTTLSNIGTNTHAQVDTHIADLSIHRELNDGTTTNSNLWSGTKIQSTIDNAVAGISWKKAVETINYIGDATVATINGLTPDAGDSYVVQDAGTLTTGSLSVAANDLVEFNGTAWQILAAAVAGDQVAGTRIALSTAKTIVGDLSAAAQAGEIYVFTGTGRTATDSNESLDTAAVLVQDDLHVGYYDNTAWVFEGTVPTGDWIQFTGTGQIVAGVGLAKNGNTLSVNMGAGIQALPSDEVGIHLTAGTAAGLALTGSATGDTLQLDISNYTAGGAISVTSGTNENIALTAAGTGNVVLSDLKLSGAQVVDTIETTITNDDTHLPTSGAIYEALGSATALSAGDGISLSAGTISLDVSNYTAGGDVRINGATDSTVYLSASGTGPLTLVQGYHPQMLKMDNDLGIFISSYKATISAADNQNITLATSGTGKIKLTNLELGEAGSTVTTILDEDTMATDSATALATQQSIKAYVDNTVTTPISTDMKTGTTALSAATTAATEAELFLADGSSRFTLVDGDRYSFKVHLMAAQADGSIGRWERQGAIRRDATTTALAGAVVPYNTDYEDTNIGAPTISIVADDTNEALAVKVTPANTTATKWYAKIEYLKIEY